MAADWQFHEMTDDEWRAVEAQEIRSQMVMLAASLVFDLAIAIGRENKGYRTEFIISNLSFVGSMYFGHGGSVNSTLTARTNNHLFDNASSEVRLFQMNRTLNSNLMLSYLDTFCKSVALCSPLHVTWEKIITTCQSTIHNLEQDAYKPYVMQCSDFGGRWICDDCKKKLTFDIPVFHRPNETKNEKQERDKMTAKLRWEILERDRFTCQSCGATPDEKTKMHVDHKIPIALGGLTIAENLHVLCSRCNLGKSAQMPTQQTLDFWERAV